MKASCDRIKMICSACFHDCELGDVTDLLNAAEHITFRLADIMSRKDDDPLVLFGTYEDQLKYNDLVNALNEIKEA